jgi:hypothetical protein
MEDLDQNTEPREDTTWEPKSLSLMVKHPSRITVSNTKLQLKVGVLRQPCPKTVLSLPWFLQHSIGQSWCSSRVSNDFLRISFGYSSYPLHDVSLFYSSHISSVHVQKPSTFASEPLDERHLISVDNVFISLHPVLWCSSYSVSSSSCTSRFLQFLFHVVLFSSLLSPTSRFTHFCVVRPLCSFWRDLIGNVQDSMCVWERTKAYYQA